MRQSSLVIWTMAGFLLIFPCGESKTKMSANLFSSQPNCDQYTLPGCPRNFNPVCGTDGNTYANECTLCEANRENHLHVAIAQKNSC